MLPLLILQDDPLEVSFHAGYVRLISFEAWNGNLSAVLRKGSRIDFLGSILSLSIRPLPCQVLFYSAAQGLS